MYPDEFDNRVIYITEFHILNDIIFCLYLHKYMKINLFC